MELKSGNPTLRAFKQAQAFTGGEVMTIGGTVNKTIAMLALVVLGAAVTWRLAATNPAAFMPIFWVGVIGGFVLALATTFKPTWAPVTGLFYAGLEGLVLGGLSYFFDMAYPGIAGQAVALTLGVFATMLVLYKARILSASPAFVRGVVMATGGVCLFYLVVIVMGLFHANTSFMYASTPLSIGISAVVVIIAALNLIIDFGMVEAGAKQGAPKYMEWYGAFSMTVTLVWLYLEILRLLSKLRSR
jgi:uncharacterized YccA/Bax inhibitor family protein